jgi:hypothetical protein
LTSENRVRSNFGKIWPAHVGSLTQFLIECRRHFDGDMDMFLVLCVIGDRTFSQRKADPSVDYESFRATAVSTPPEDINIRSIADFSGIPRETVRRKVGQLEEKGWIARKDDGFIVATLKAKQDLEPLTLTSIKYVARMMKLLAELPES